MKKLQTPWDSDEMLMVDIGCFERGCAMVAGDWAAGERPECRAMVDAEAYERLRAAGRQALDVMDDLHRTGDTQVFDMFGCEATEALRAALSEDAMQRLTDVQQEMGSKDLSEESLNELVAQLKAATADRESRINFTPTHMAFTGDTLDCLKKLADERNADTGKTSDHIADVSKMVDQSEDALGMVATSRKSRQVEATIKRSLIVEPVAWITPGQDLHLVNYEGFQDWTPLYAAPPKREPLTDEELIKMWQAIDHGKIGHTIDFARAIERAHGIGGEE